MAVPRVTLFVFGNNDLRLQDNRALKHALDLDLPIVFLSCLAVGAEWNRKWLLRKAWGPHKREFRLQCLQDLDNRLKTHLVGDGNTTGKADTVMWCTEKSVVDGVKNILDTVGLFEFHSEDCFKVEHLVMSEVAGTYEAKEQRAVAALESSDLQSRFPTSK